MVDEDVCSEDLSDAVSSWDELNQMHALAYAVNNSNGDQEYADILTAASLITPQVLLELLDIPDISLLYSTFNNLGLYNCSTIIDVHLRLLKDCMIQDDYELVNVTYKKIATMGVQDATCQAVAEVAAEALLNVREEHEVIVSMLEESVMDVSGATIEATKDFYTSKALLKAVDTVLELLPLPEVEE
ncbi:hypothetical protein CYMTET_46656 [Cymbomonas tetramitiformis]|uniref:Uncharacterized protein n=1 Tax=Cymbomonas tetramitiformis TaxID=36881 RepID=A0AAE0EX28_9CHLO|nr:hypothetical protein CYMTET_46656 [Cymbomonas tetramitiformis]|eukprot:gene25887-31683_t